MLPGGKVVQDIVAGRQADSGTKERCQLVNEQCLAIVAGIRIVGLNGKVMPQC